MSSGVRVLQVSGGLVALAAACAGSSELTAGEAALTAQDCAAGAAHGRVTVCHATSSSTNPYVTLALSVEGCIHGHAGHVGDFVTAGGSPCAPPVVATWLATTSLDPPRFDHAAVVHGGRMYVLGGGDAAGGQLDRVDVAPILPDGGLGPWSATSPFPIRRAGLTSAELGGYLYVFGGGRQPGGQTADVSYAPIHADGTVGPWNSTTPLPAPRQNHGTAVYGGRLYVTAGNFGEGGVNWSDVLMATPNPDGSLGPWTALTPLPAPMSTHSSIAAMGYLYVLGGAVTGQPANDSVLRAPIHADGTIGAWALLPAHLPTPRSVFGAVVLGDRAFIMGGLSAGQALDDLYAAPLPELDVWSPQTPLPTGRMWMPAVTASGRLYLLGGLDTATVHGDVHVLTPSAP